MKIFKFEDVLSKEVYCNSNVSLKGVWERSPQPPEAIGAGGEAPSRWTIFCSFLKKKALLTPLDRISHVSRAI